MFRTVITLICNPASACLDRALMHEALAAAATLCSGTIEHVSLADGIAADILLDADIARDRAATAMGDALAGAPVDVVVQPTAHRRKALLIADMDSTIIEQECLDELAFYAGLKDEISAVTERAMRGELDFEAALTERVARLKGLAVTALEETFRDKITLTPGARTLIATMRAHGAFTALVSGGFTYFTERVAARAGFDVHRANTLDITGDTLAGTVSRPILGRDAKRDYLLTFTRDHQIDLADTMAVGDGANDLAMIETAGLGVAFRAKPAIAARAHAKISHGDLTALLYMQGYKQSAFRD